MRDSFLALRDSCRDSGRDWFPILFFSARAAAARTRELTLSDPVKCHRSIL